MTELPPDENSSDGVDERYRAASSREAGRPRESVRRAVLEHAADLAAQRASAKRPVDIDFKRRAANQAWRRHAAYGGLAAAVLAGLLIAPRFLTPSYPPQEIARVGPPAPATESDIPEVPAARSAKPEPSRQDRAGRLAEDNDRFAGGSSARNAPPAALAPVQPAEQPGARNGASAQSAPAAPAAPSSPPPLEALAGRFTPAPAAPAASLSAGVARSIDMGSALRQAAALGDLPRLRALLAQRAAIDSRDPSGRSPLMLAVLYGRADAVDLLLATGADANAADANGTTPLQAALARNRSDIVEALRRAGAR